MNFLILFFGIASNAAASVLIKYALPARSEPVLYSLAFVLTQFKFWIGLFCYGVALVLYTLALTRLPLNVAHPILTSGSIAAVALVSFVVFGEAISMSTLLGIALVIAGVVLISLQVKG